MSDSVQVCCGNVFCDEKIERLCEDVEIKKSQGKYHFCGLSCAGYYKNTKDAQNHLRVRESFILTKKELSFILKIIGGIKKKSKPKSVNYRKNAHIKTSISEIIDVCEDQQGICNFSKVRLQTESVALQMYKATLDRIDSTKPYEKGNLQFLSQAMNNMKNTMSQENVLKLLKILNEI